jgi:hypothetical protein
VTVGDACDEPNEIGQDAGGERPTSDCGDREDNGEVTLLVPDTGDKLSS